MRVHGRLPNELETLALRAATLPGAEAIGAWERFLDLAGGLDAVSGASFAALPAAYRNLARQGGEVPELARLKGIYRQTWFRNQVLVREASSVVAALAAGGCRPLLLKGGAIVAAYDSDLGVRPMGDIDVLVPYAQAERAAAVVVGLGWTNRDPIRAAPRGGASEATRLRRTIRYSHGVGFESPRGANVDLHWLSLMENPQPSADDGLRRTARPETLGGIACLVPSPEEMLVHVSVHGLRWVGPPTLTWALDAAAIVRATPEFDWDEAVAAARARRVAGIVHDAWEYLAANLDLPIPKFALGATRDTSRLSLSDRVVRWSRPGERPARRIWAVRVTSYLGASSAWPPHRRIWNVPDYVCHTWGLEHCRSIPGEFVRRVVGLRSAATRRPRP